MCVCVYIKWSLLQVYLIKSETDINHSKTFSNFNFMLKCLEWICIYIEQKNWFHYSPIKVWPIVARLWCFVFWIPMPCSSDLWKTQQIWNITTYCNKKSCSWPFVGVTDQLLCHPYIFFYFFWRSTLFLYFYCSPTKSPLLLMIALN